jgi:RecB family exonuclease
MDQLPLDGMPVRLFSCTPSRLTTWLDCPRRYRMVYLDRPAPPKGAPWAHNSFGATVHNALRSWWDVPVQRRTPATGRALVDRGWIRDGYRDDEQEARQRERAAALVEGYTATLDPLDEPVGVERTVAVRTERLALSGRVDRIDRRGDELVIVDYKTGRRPPTADEARGSLALAAYAMGAERTLRRRCRTVELHHLPTGTIASWTHTDESLQRHVAMAEAIAVEVTAAAEHPARPSSACSWCDFLGVCAEGQAAASRRDSWAALDDSAA